MQPGPATRDARATLSTGSSSFAAASRLLAPALRYDVALLYAWCRHCDDVIDGQELGGARRHAPADADAVAALREATLAGLAGEAPEGCVFAGLGRVAARHRIPSRYPLDLIDGFAMDASCRRFRTLGDTLGYAYCVAGAVGVMMAHVMDVRDTETLRRASDLGIAFQLSNIARDVVDDARAGRIYLPESWLIEVDVPLDEVADPAHRATVATAAARLVQAAEPYYASARAGIARLPWRSACGIAAAWGIYREIGLMVRARGSAAWDERVATGPGRKAALAAIGCLRATRARTPIIRRSIVARDGLFTPPALA